MWSKAKFSALDQQNKNETDLKKKSLYIYQSNSLKKKEAYYILHHYDYCLLLNVFRWNTKKE